MRHVKSFILTLLCFLASKIAHAQNSSASMYVQSEALLNVYAKDTLYASLGAFGEEALILTNKKHTPAFTLSRCSNRSTPIEVNLVKIGKDLYKIEGKVIVKLKESTLKQALRFFHCDHYSHTSHYSHYSGR